jgi:tetratricopeptide (TPR) repeat protein
VSQLDLELAEELLRKGRYAQAIERLRMLLSDRPDDAEIRGRVAEAYRLSGNQERAFHHFNKAAAIFTRQNEVLGAYRMLKAANTVSPNEPDILFRMGECLKMLGNTRELEPVLRQLIGVARASGDRRRVWALDELCALQPDDLDLATQHATALGESGRVKEAVETWKRVSARLDQRGVDIAPLLLRAAEIAGDYPEVGVDLAEILMAHRRSREALALLVPFYEKFPDEVRVLESLLRALEQIGAHDKVVPARIELVKARTKLGQRGQAVTEITKLLKEAPSDPQALEVSAHACLAFGITGEATRLWFQLARLHDDTGDTAARDRALFACLKANPNHEAALELGARVLRQAGREDEASSLDRRLREVRRSTPDVGELPSAPMGATDSHAALSPLDETEDPWRSKSATVMLDDNDVLEEVSEMPGDAVIDVERPNSGVSTPSYEAMPIHQHPWHRGPSDPAQAAAHASAETRIASQLGAAPPAPSKTKDPLFTGRLAAELALPSENTEHDDEETTRMSSVNEDELKALREEFGSDDQPTWVELETQTSLTPAGGTPLEADDFATRVHSRQRLVSDLHEELEKKKSSR